MNIETYAIEINDKTYPIVLACIPSIAAIVPFSTIDGQVLVINKPTVSSSKGQTQITITNCIMSKDAFTKEYQPGNPAAIYYEFTTLISK